MILNIVFLALLAALVSSDGEVCVKDSVQGVCKNIMNCPPALDDIRKRKNPQICGFSGTDPIVCCIDRSTATVTTTRGPVVTTSTQRTRTTTEYVPPVYEYENNDNTELGSCSPVSPDLTAPKTGQKAWDKCIEYQEQLVYPCEKGAALTGELTRVSKCGHTADQLIIGGVDAARKEFPHMVLLGFGQEPETLQFLCGGSLISDRFILTAGHCTYSRDTLEVTYALVGAYKRSDQVDKSRLYRLKRIVKHPEYKPPGKYNDIALLETGAQMKLDQWTVPACLPVGAQPNDGKALATGWGSIEYRGPSADILQKVTLSKFTEDMCRAKFPNSRNMKDGFNATTQLCYGDLRVSKDTCQGDSGGPLQIKNQRIHCMYTVIGVTSFGKACGWVGDPGIYTRVAPYVAWIESVVWS